MSLGSDPLKFVVETMQNYFLWNSCRKCVVYIGGTRTAVPSTAGRFSLPYPYFFVRLCCTTRRFETRPVVQHRWEFETCAVILPNRTSFQAVFMASIWNFPCFLDIVSSWRTEPCLHVPYVKFSMLPEKSRRLGRHVYMLYGFTFDHSVIFLINLLRTNWNSQGL